MRSLFAVVAAFGLSSIGTGCVVHSVDPNPQPAIGGQEDARGYRNAPDATESNADRHPRAVSGRWWESFRDHDLDSLVSQALADNPDLRSTGRRIDQANASLIRAGATLFPQIDGGGDLSRRWNREGRTDDEASLGLSLDWELDAWGRIRSGRSARAEEVEAAREDWQAARLLLTGAVAETWFELIEQRGQLRLAREQIEVNQTLLDLTRLRFGQGQSSVVDVLQQQEQLESTQALVPDIEARIEELELALETLTGRLPGTRHLPERNDEPAEPPARPKAGYPADLLAERPDLRAQRARIVALDHEVGEAIADCLPRFSIGGSLALAGTPSLDRLIGDAIAGAVGPVFDAGSRKAEVARRRSRVQEEVYRYTSAYLNAVRDVETSLHRETKLAERVRRQEAQLATARKLLAESRNRYSLGATDYLPVLDAVAKVQGLERDLLTSRRERLSARVALHRALGGPMPEMPR